ncbi:PFOR [Symbiodinium natans]|uniref:PFOR protein n=1 Tax=Symbiodinium natans TaxID=878477 RepID=A0A812M4A2_9DINO|nr:PFOR [Symbiodinium natans]
MDILSKRPEIEDVLQRGLLRTVAGSDILQGFGSVFRKDMHLDEDVSTQAFEVDIFVSHSWSSDGWPKYLALCRVLNLGKALEAVALVLVLIFLAASCRGIGRRSGYDRDTIFFVAVSWLVVLGIFFQVLFLGQHATCGERKPTLWLDRLCIEQTDARQKASGIAALPVFVARSSQFLMLYDESYLDRLWCIVELATFVKKSGCEPVHFVPLWLPRWLLTTMLLDILQGCVCIAALLVWSWSSPQELSPLASDRGLNHFLNNLLLVLILLPGYIVVLAPSMWALGQKAQGHEEMLQQFAAFDIRRCKCSDPSDRQPLETLVNELFASTVSAGGSAVCSVSEASGTSKEVTSLSEAEESTPQDR